MSNPIKAVGKAFKKVVRVVKKVALPALAIGAVVLTGGAALGVLPALGGAGGLLASVGIKGALAGILTGAAKAATFGAIGAALTGRNIVKGATMGFVTGGALGGLSAALGGGAAAAGSGASGATAAGGSAATAGALPSGGLIPTGVAASGGGATLGAAASTGLGAASGLAGSAAPVTSVGLPSSGGVLGFINQNPVLVGNVVQGLGSGMAARAEAKQRDKESASRRARYAGVEQGLYFMPQGTDGMGPLLAQDQSMPAQSSKVRYDRATGQLVAVS
jgi:hypothetical protein